MDRNNDLTIDVVFARSHNPNEMLIDHYKKWLDDNTSQHGFRTGKERTFLIGGARFSLDEIISPTNAISSSFNVESEHSESYRNIFGKQDKNSSHYDPYSEMWGNDTNCDRCGKDMHSLNRPNPCYGCCIVCTEEMETENKEYLELS